jgi:hypothetical protein
MNELDWKCFKLKNQANASVKIKQTSLDLHHWPVALGWVPCDHRFVLLQLQRPARRS